MDWNGWKELEKTFNDDNDGWNDHISGEYIGDFKKLGWIRLYVWIVWEIPFIQGDSSRDLFIPKRWRLRFTFERVTKITIPKSSQLQNCQGYRYHWKKAYLRISYINCLELGAYSMFVGIMLYLIWSTWQFSVTFLGWWSVTLFNGYIRDLQRLGMKLGHGWVIIWYMISFYPLNFIKLYRCSFEQWCFKPLWHSSGNPDWLRFRHP